MLQPHGGKPGLPVTAEHWGQARRLSRAGAEMLTTGFGPLCPWGMVGPLVCPGTWDGNPAEEGALSPGTARPQGSRLGWERPRAMEIWGSRGWQDAGVGGSLGSSHLQIQIPVHPPPSPAPGDGGAGSCRDRAHRVPMAPLLVR